MQINITYKLDEPRGDNMCYKKTQSREIAALGFVNMFKIWSDIRLRENNIMFEWFGMHFSY